ncbi:Rapid ALkalinization Factor [Melia azedarach]|uniref:Rapid ALkalinization Factor n=1 Tax=Melia azedarach TaxID=155640 RepID=A0ACC1YJ02_MELAZ|nr:Rapid ALkalinization Factor [Melia azedarach]
MEPKLTILPLHFSFFLILFLLLFSKAATARSAQVCNGSIAECNEEFEMLMESEISRRFLEGKKYITPGALKPDQPVCNGGSRGGSYSKSGGCLPPPSNPEDRGCPTYYRCRSGS